MKAKNLFWGAFFLVSAVFVIACQTGAFGQIGILSILATILLIGIAIQSIIHLNFFGVFVPAALLYIIYQQPLHLLPISIWILLSAAVLASIGFSFIFNVHSHHPWHDCCSGAEKFSEVKENLDDNNPCVSVSFNSSSKYLHADCLKSGRFNSSFGSLELFFDQTLLSPDGAEIILECSFSSMKLYIPKQWNVIEEVRASLGGVQNDVRLSRPEEGAPRLKISGNVSFGSVEIHYI